MGGRGAKSGVKTAGQNNFISKDRTLTRGEEPIKVERLIADFGLPHNSVLNATTDENGNLTLNYSSAESYREQNSKTKYGQHTITNGITNIGTEGDDIKSVGINWDAVQTVSGETYIARKFLREKGFNFDKPSKTWERPGQTSKVTSTSIEKMSRKQLESESSRFYVSAMKSRGLSEQDAVTKFSAQVKTKTDQQLKDYLFKKIDKSNPFGRLYK